MLPRLLFLLFFVPSLLSCQNSVTGEFSPAAEYEFGILYRLTPTGKVYAINKSIENGVFKAELPADFKEGMYRMVYKLPEDYYYFDMVLDGKEDVDFKFSQNTGLTFSNSQNKILDAYLIDMDSLQDLIFEEYASAKPDVSKLKQLFQQQKEIQIKAEKDTEGKYSHSLVQALQPYLPANVPGSSAYERNLKKHYFDNFDFSDEKLQSSPFPLRKIVSYYDQFVTQKGGSFYRTAINDIAFAVRNTSPEYQKKLLSDFWDFLVANKKNHGANYLADSYLNELGNQANDMALIQKLEWFKNLSIGSKAPDFEWKDQQGILHSLYETQGADYYILAFWSSGCSHCMEQMPELHKKMKSMNTDKIRMLAIGLETEEEHWLETVPNMPDFTHILKTDDARVDIAKTYNVTATPTYYVLDKDKKIIGQPRGQKNLFGIIDALMEYKR